MNLKRKTQIVCNPPTHKTTVYILESILHSWNEFRVRNIATAPKQGNITQEVFNKLGNHVNIWQLGAH